MSHRFPFPTLTRLNHVEKEANAITEFEKKTMNEKKSQSAWQKGEVSPLALIGSLALLATHSKRLWAVMEVCDRRERKKRTSSRRSSALH